MANSTNVLYSFTPNTNHLLSEEAIDATADFFKLLSEPSRLKILCTLKGKSRNVTEVMVLSGLGQANVSKHLKLMARAGLVKRTPQGTSAYYEIENPAIFSLCDLACATLSIQLQQQASTMANLHAFKQAL